MHPASSEFPPTTEPKDPMALNNVTTALLSLLVYDLIFLLILIAIVAILAGTKRAAFAVMRRNFVGYFSNPTGYVFLCIFVLLDVRRGFLAL